MFHQQEDVTSEKGRALLDKTEIFPGGPCWGEITGDALPTLPNVHNGCGKYDIYFSDFHPQFWSVLAKGWDEQREQQDILFFKNIANVF
jgi:hypothetical protein